MCMEETPSRIEVTPKMLDAGVLRFYEGDQRVESLREILKRVFLEMWSARGLASSNAPRPLKKE